MSIEMNSDLSTWETHVTTRRGHMARVPERHFTSVTMSNIEM